MNLIKVVVWVVVIGFVAYGLHCWWQRRRAVAWEKRPRIGFQPNPAPAMALRWILGGFNRALKGVGAKRVGVKNGKNRTRQGCPTSPKRWFCPR